MVLGGVPAAPSLKTGSASHFSAHVYCAQTAGWINMPLGTKVDLGPCQLPHCVTLDPAQPQKDHIPQFSADVYCGQTVAHLSYCSALVFIYLYLFSGTHLQVRCVDAFWRVMAQPTRTRARMCLFWVSLTLLPI